MLNAPRYSRSRSSELFGLVPTLALSDVTLLGDFQDSSVPFFGSSVFAAGWLMPLCTERHWKGNSLAVPPKLIFTAGLAQVQ